MREEIRTQSATQEELYRQVSDGYSAALERLVRAHESDPDRRRDLLQEVHLARWRSLACLTSAVRYEPGCTGSRTMSPSPTVSAAGRTHHG